MTYLVTGVAGFIGAAIARTLLERGEEVIGIDNLNEYYDVKLKQDRLELLKSLGWNAFHHIDVADREGAARIFEECHPRIVIHMAAQAGVRYSLENPSAYVDSNLVGFSNLLESCRQHRVDHLVFASSSSVYGANTRVPFSEHDNVDHPLSLYAATKKANELMAHAYAHLFGLPCTGLRFFTVYGPWGRPDMALFLFCRAILAGQPIKVFNSGNMSRDFTYIDDIVEAAIRVAQQPAEPDSTWSGAAPNPARSCAPYRIFNIGNGKPESLLKYIEAIEESLGRKAQKQFLPMQPGDVPNTFADTSALEKATGFKPATPISQGVRQFVQWYKNRYRPGNK
jgi:UDP-glucuronate 4-epimerase